VTWKLPSGGTKFTEAHSFGARIHSKKEAQSKGICVSNRGKTSTRNTTRGNASARLTRPCYQEVTFNSRKGTKKKGGGSGHRGRRKEDIRREGTFRGKKGPRRGQFRNCSSGCKADKQDDYSTGGEVRSGLLAAGRQERR